MIIWTKQCEDVIEALEKAEMLTENTVDAIKTRALTVGKFVKENIEKI